MEATKLLLHGCDARELELYLRAWKEQGAPTTNRAKRRQVLRLAEQARRARRFEAPRHVVKATCS
jgi:hypothetical protein